MPVTATTVKKVLLITGIFFLTSYLQCAQQSPDQEAIRHLVIKTTVRQIEACIARGINLNDIQFPTDMHKDNLAAYLLLRQEAFCAIKERYLNNPEREKRQHFKQRLKRLASQLLYPPTPFDSRKDDPFVSDQTFDPYILEQHPEIRLQPTQQRSQLFCKYFQELTKNKALYDRLTNEHDEYQLKEQAKRELLTVFLRTPIK